MKIQQSKPEYPAVKIESLQFLRAFACILVVLHHFSYTLKASAGCRSYIVSSGIGDLGRAGVDIFFVLSGFIMFHSLQKSSRPTFPGGIAAGRTFMLKRIKRVMPIYWIWTVVLLVLWRSGIFYQVQTFSARYILSSLLLYPTMLPDHSIHPVLYQGWTLTFEMYFYLVFAIALFFNSSKYLFLLIASLFSLFALAAFIFPIGYNLKHLFTNQLLLEFLLGIAAYYITNLKKYPDYKKYNVTAFVLALVLFAATLFFKTDQYRSLTYGIPAFLMLCAMINLHSMHKQNYLEKVLLFIGNASYSVYLTHGFAILLFSAYLNGHRISVQGDVVILSLTILTVAVCSLAYIFIERPIIQFFNKARAVSAETAAI